MVDRVDELNAALGWTGARKTFEQSLKCEPDAWDVNVNTRKEAERYGIKQPLTITTEQCTA